MANQNVRDKMEGTRRVQAEFKYVQKEIQEGRLPQIHNLRVRNDNVLVWMFDLKDFDEDLKGGRQLNEVSLYSSGRASYDVCLGEGKNWHGVYHEGVSSSKHCCSLHACGMLWRWTQSSRTVHSTWLIECWNERERHFPTHCLHWLLPQDLKELKRKHGQDHILMEITFSNSYPRNPFFLRVVSPRCQWYTGHVSSLLTNWWTQSMFGNLLCFRIIWMVSSGDVRWLNLHWGTDSLRHTRVLAAKLLCRSHTECCHCQHGRLWICVCDYANRPRRAFGTTKDWLGM